jgi:hypothetical protein
MTLLHGLVDHAKVVACTDENILNSDVAEPWMIAKKQEELFYTLILNCSPKITVPNL